MASSDAVWGIDIGQCALKAIRLRSHPSDKSKVVADGYDFIEYAQILGQPDADSAALVRDALKTFLSRNEVHGSQVAMSVSGQAGLSRFIKLPPVETKKIPDIVKYEAKQQIPFKLEDVAWDFQTMPGSSEEDGFALETEVGLFAMKRDQLFRSLKPLDEVGIEVNFVQLTPLAIFNYVAYDQLGELPSEFDSENPPPSVVILSVGTDSTDLVVTNGFRVWQRSIPLGGNHFTKALTKQLKLTFGKAEHLKRNANAAKAEDAKALFKAMKPVFSDMLTEVQTSLRYFQMNVDKNAKIDRIVALGSAFKLPGLRRFLAQNLDIDVVETGAFNRLAGPEVLKAPSFRENILSFGVCYGLALQGLGRTTLRTNLLPQEINVERMIRDKKPWALAAAAMLMLGFVISYFGNWRALNAASDLEYKSAEYAVKSLNANISDRAAAYAKVKQEFEATNASGGRMASYVESGRLRIELLKAIDACLPKIESPVPEALSERKDLQITSINCEWQPSEAIWFNSAVRERYNLLATRLQLPAAQAPEGPAVEEEGVEFDPNAPGGWVVQIQGLHYNNSDRAEGGQKYVEDTFVKNLLTGSVKLPNEDGELVTVSCSDLGIRHALVVQGNLREKETNPQKLYDPSAPALVEYQFTVQFWWEPQPLSARREAAVKRANQPAPADSETEQ